MNEDKKRVRKELPNPWKGKRPWIPKMLKRGGIHETVKHKKSRVNDKVENKKEQDNES